MSELDFFRLKGLEYGQLTGVNIGVHALNDAFMLMHCGVGCKHKTTSQLSTHDLARNVVEREGWTEVGDAELITGSSERIGPYLRSWYQRVEPSLIVVISVTFLELTGEDVPFIVKDESQSVGCPVLYIPASGTLGDLYLGYQNTVLAVLRLLNWKKPPIHNRGVAILGYYFDRYEGDHLGNIQQLQLLVKLLGLELGPVALSGVSIGALEDIPQMKYQLLFPHLATKRKRLQRFSKRSMIEVPLPMGFQLIKIWLQNLATAANYPKKRLELIIAKKEAQTRSKLQIAQRLLRGKQLAIIADLPHAIGLYGMLQDLGCHIAFIGIRGSSLGGKHVFLEQLNEYGLQANNLPPVFEELSLAQLQTEITERCFLEELDGVIASATELNSIAHIPDLENPPFGIEFGFPCKNHHLTRNTPYFGYTGLLCFADRLLETQNTTISTKTEW